MRKYKEVEIERLVPYANNARTHSLEQVKKIQASLREFGFINPVLIDGEYGIIAGHGRVEAAKAEGMDKVPCIFIDDLTEAQKKAYILADNRLAEDAGWDEELLQIELEGLEEVGFDLDLTGFNIDDFKVEESAEIVEDEYEIEIAKKPTTKLGDIYQLGRHRLMCGDCTCVENVGVLMKNGEVQANLLITDPPYNIAYEGKTDECLKIANDEMNSTDFREFLKDAFFAANENIKSGGVFYIWHAGIESYNFIGACNDIGWKIRECLIWNKNIGTFGRQDYHWKHEPCLYGWKDGASHCWNSDRKQTTVLDFDKPMTNREHPTMKPVSLFSYQIQNNTYEGDVVLDIFGGSGTTMIACEQLNRNCYMMELDPKYCDVIINRWEQFTGEKAVLLNDMDSDSH